MKQCPICKSVFPADNDFCLIDGSSLVPVRAAAQPPPYQNVSNMPTQVIYQTPPTKPATVGNPSKWLYLAVGGIGAVIIAAAFFIFWPENKGTSNDKFANAGRSSDDQKSSAAVTTGLNANQDSSPISTPAPNISPAGRWSGDWSSPSGAYLTIAVDLNDDGSGRLSGSIEWTLRRTTRPDKMSKIGMSATEYVSGQFDPGTRALTMKGFRKDDPNNVLVMVDSYRLVLSGDSRRLNGTARNGGKWNASVNLAR